MEPGPPKKRKVNNESYDQEVTSSVTSSSSSIQVVDLSVIPPSPQIPGTSKEAATSGQMDSKLRELLLSSPAHLFGHQPAAQPGGNNPQAAVTSWENWLCVLATNLSPAQWQGYWLAHCALFGEQAVPVHMLSFFQGQTSPSSSSSPSSTIQQGPHPNDAIQERYEMGNAASGGSSGNGGSSRRAGGGGGAGNEFGSATVFSNGRLAAAETSEFFLVLSWDFDGDKL
ncbi:hypothetical protein GCK72_003569 [Caenorhabditis remanei]|uniref:Uncharacterized protein n=1 Tax=Caenorhabditis remanei TaxID=31234 RepID=A0A6A5HWP3_CAERE|nr:hypothetical protein GCK72_003569 [Caenorhabditis remanei]KAF1771741.1 hypothetical protein GCK72_003569 [Caenorhabditis remanei]